MTREINITPISKLLECLEIIKFIHKKLASDLIFLKKFDKVFKQNVCSLPSKKERADKLLNFYNYDDKNKFVFEYFALSYIKKHLYHERTRFQQEEFDKLEKILNNINKEFEK